MQKVPESHVKSVLSGNVRQLKKADKKPIVNFAADEPRARPSLTVIRDGEAHVLPLSPRVAEELIAAGFAHGS